MQVFGTSALTNQSVIRISTFGWAGSFSYDNVIMIMILSPSRQLNGLFMTRMTQQQWWQSAVYFVNPFCFSETFI